MSVQQDNQPRVWCAFVMYIFFCCIDFTQLTRCSMFISHLAKIILKVSNQCSPPSWLFYTIMPAHMHYRPATMRCRRVCFTLLPHCSALMACETGYVVSFLARDWRIVTCFQTEYAIQVNNEIGFEWENLEGQVNLFCSIFPDFF